jgi:hypothetical protein
MPFLISPIRHSLGRRPRHRLSDAAGRVPSLLLLVGAAALAAWSAIHLFLEFVLVSESYVRAGVF